MVALTAADAIEDGQQVAAPADDAVDGVRIAEVRVQDLRGLTDLCVALGELTVLVGENNVGKTTFLRALDVAIGGARPSQDDLHVPEVGDRVAEFIVDLKLVPANGAAEFNDALAGRFGAAVQLPPDEPQYVTLRTRGTSGADGADPKIEHRFVAGWSCDRATALAFAELDRASRDQLRLIAFFLLDARRDIVEELRQRYSYWGRLLADIGIDPADKLALEAQLAALGSEVVAKSAVLKSLKDELEHVKDAFGSAVSAVAIEPIPARVDEVIRAVDVMLKAPNSAALPLRLQGLGSRSLAVVMVFQAFTQLRLGADQDIRPLPVAAFEEPEAHLHPHPQRAMFALIRDLPGQKVISTHSPYVSQVADLFDIRAFTRVGAGVFCRQVHRLRPDGTPAFDVDALAKARRFVQKNNGEVLFARCVVLYEGDTEDGAIGAFCRARWGLDASAHGASLVDAQGAGNFGCFARVLESLGIPWAVFVDGDMAGTNAVTAIENALGRATTGDEVFQIPGGDFFEQNLITEGFQAEVESAIAAVHGATALADYRTNLDGEKGRGGVIRDYQSGGWEDRLLFDFCVGNMKSAVGGIAIAEAIQTAVDLGAQPSIPSTIASMLERVDQILGLAP